MIGTADIGVRAVTSAARQPERRCTAKLVKPVALMAAGLLASTGGMGIALFTGNGGDAPAPAPAPASAPAAKRATALQPSDFAMVAITYDPRQSSGWHVHPGIHAVHVLSGSLTVYDENCVGRTYGPDQSYVGGRDVHLARNETAEPVRMVVTYVEPGNPAPADLSFALPPPPNCPH